jgi:hypothetical protein
VENMRKELSEELGIVDRPVEFIGHRTVFREGLPQVVAIDFLVRVRSDVPRCLEPELHQDGGWFTPMTLPANRHSQLLSFLGQYSQYIGTSTARTVLSLQEVIETNLQETLKLIETLGAPVTTLDGIERMYAPDLIDAFGSAESREVSTFVEHRGKKVAVIVPYSSERTAAAAAASGGAGDVA